MKKLSQRKDFEKKRNINKSSKAQSKNKGKILKGEPQSYPSYKKDKLGFTKPTNRGFKVKKVCQKK